MKNKPAAKVKDDSKQPLSRMITENVECLAIAIIMALMLKFFLIEAYKIPTGSMQPTIMGNAEQGLFDRVLVNKFIYLISKPERWDVIVFKYPLDQAKNYIKRLIGLPGETVTIRNGDIYVNGTIARKPENAALAVLKKIYPAETAGETLDRFFETSGDCRVEGPDQVAFTGPGRITTRASITAGYLDGYDPSYNIPKPARLYLNEDQRVGDLRLSFKVALEDDRGGLEASIEEGGKLHTLFLRGKACARSSAMTSGSAISGSAPKVWDDPEIHLEKNETYELTFSHIDDQLTLSLDKDEIASYAYEDTSNDLKHSKNRISFGPVDCGASFEDISIHRDIYYLPGNGSSEAAEFAVPPGHYFALGDNTQNSADSRLWKSVVFTMKDGRFIQGNYDPMRQNDPYRQANPQRIRGGGFQVTDIFGDSLMLPGAQLKEASYTTIPTQFISEKLMLGKAMVVFWPVYPHFRWKLLR